MSPNAGHLTSSASRLAEALTALLDAATACRCHPNTIDPDYEAVADLHARVVGVAAAVGLQPPPPEDAGLPIYDRVQLGEHTAYKPRVLIHVPVGTVSFGVGPLAWFQERLDLVSHGLEVAQAGTDRPLEVRQAVEQAVVRRPTT